MRNYFFAFLSLLLFNQCHGKTTHAIHNADDVHHGNTERKIVFRNVEILCLIPADSVPVKGDLLLLPGWNFSNTKWCDSTDVCATALKKGYRVIAPQMGQSIYATRYFPETRKDLAAYPTLRWLDSAIQYLQDSLHFFDKKRYVLGLSTGGRGVAQICLYRRDFFHAAASLSGDFNQLTIPKDPLCTLVYGPYAKFPKRWEMTDNPVKEIGRTYWMTPIYIGHGQKDKVVPWQQSKDFEHAIREFSANANYDGPYPAVLHLDPAAGHNFAYWRSELPAVWAFFESH